MANVLKTAATAGAVATTGVVATTTAVAGAAVKSISSGVTAGAVTTGAIIAGKVTYAALTKHNPKKALNKAVGGAAITGCYVAAGVAAASAVCSVVGGTLAVVGTAKAAKLAAQAANTNNTSDDEFING